LLSDAQWHGEGVDEDGRRIGDRVRSARVRQGVSLDALAAATGLSKSFLSRAERGQRSLDRRSTLQTIADALHVPVTELTGQPYRPLRPEDVHAQAAVVDIRDLLLGTELGEPADVPVRPAEALRREVWRVRHLMVAGDLGGFGPLLPDLLAELHALSADESHRAEALPLLVDALYAAQWLAKSLGHHDLSWLAVERASQAAERAGQPAVRGLTELLRALALMPVGARSRGRALSIAEAAADRLEPHASTGPPAEMYGMLHLAQAYAYTVAGNGPAAEAHLREAEETADRTGDGVAWDFWFGRPNIGVWRMSLAIEAGEPDRAVAIAPTIDVDRLPSPSRRANYWTDLGRALARQRRTRPDAVSALGRAEHLAPQQIRNDPHVRETVAELLVDVGGSDLRALGRRVGALA
jgi:transcriptional regulator with XRE-family HTH domain